MNFQSLQELMDRLTAWRIPGNAVCVYWGGEKVFSYQSGYADLENRIPMTADHYINLYSCSKVATVTAALQLYEQGHYLLDDPLYSFIPEFRDMWIKGADGSLTKAQNPITLRHLFTMTSGFHYNSNTPFLEEARKLTGGNMDTLDVIRCFAKEPLSFEPGERWQYSLSHDVLAAVVEVISGKRFSTYVQENIFDPLGMDRSMYHNQPVRDLMAQQYRYVNSSETDPVLLQSDALMRDNGYIVNVSKDMSYDFGPGFDSGGAGITSTVNDYAKFAAALAAGGMGLTGERILAPGTVELMKTNQLTPQQARTYSWSQVKGYGYGLGVRTMTDKALSGSIGNIGEFGWGGAAGGSVHVDTQLNLAMFYAHHMLNPQEPYYMPRIRNVLYKCITG